MVRSPRSPGHHGRRRRVAGSPADPIRRPRRATAAGPSRRSRFVLWFGGILAAAVVSAVIGVNTEQVRDWLSSQDPVASSLQPTGPPNSFSLVAPDAGAVPAGAASISDCDDLWQAGLRAGASTIYDRSDRLVLQGTSRDGAVITGLRARVTGRGPAEGDALLNCPSAGADEPLGFSFDLSRPDGGAAPDRAEAVRHPVDPDEASDQLTQFADGFTVSLKENEFVPMVLTTSLPEDKITWVVDADVWVDGALRIVTIDNNGRDFYSPGVREQNDYRAGYTAGVEQATWGVDSTARPAPDARIDYRGLSFPAPEGVDVYQPLDGVAPQGKRWIRQDGRPLVEFNPVGSAPDLAPVIGSDCSSWDDERYGLVESVQLVSQRPGSRSARVQRSTADVVCSSSASTTVVRYETALLPTGTLAATIVDDLSEADREQAMNILDGLDEIPDLRRQNVSADVTAAALPPHKRPRAPDIGAVTDVGHLMAVTQDPRGLVIELDAVDYTACACPGGGRVQDRPGDPLRLIVPQYDATIVGVADSERAASATIDLDAGGLIALQKQRSLVVLNRTASGAVTALAEVG